MDSIAVRTLAAALIGTSLLAWAWPRTSSHSAHIAQSSDQTVAVAPSAAAEQMIASEPAKAADVTPRAPEPVHSRCPNDMVLVEGEYCTDVRHDCINWLDDESLPFARCGEYKTPARCVGRKTTLRFCIDRDEYTPHGDSLPMNWASFNIASDTCKSIGKRICMESEWNFACEGEEMRPYPYGFKREPKCNQDREDLFENNPHRQVLRDLREANGARPDCVSPFGVYNMVGNLDEPVRRDGTVFAPPFSNALKGGWWMPARNRCRPATTAHDDHYKDIQIGVRCCSDPGEPAAENANTSLKD